MIIAGVRDDRLALGRPYVDEVQADAPGIDAAVRRMAGTDDP